MNRRHLCQMTAMLPLALSCAPASAATQSGILYKDRNCPCCEGHAKYLKENDIDVAIIPVDDIAAISQGAGIPADYQGCHVLLMDGYAIEGHVAVDLIRKLLKDRPADLAGISIPGMPPDVPGMNGPNKDNPVTVYAIHKSGAASVYGTQ